jgi:hypothetical protein
LSASPLPADVRQPPTPVTLTAYVEIVRGTAPAAALRPSPGLAAVVQSPRFAALIGLGLS